ncbi:hypothetical protein ACL2XP_16130 [Sodalis sp. RH21]|uniref:hypothetical protein n=1 Tax=unclassified Sodalis (in: enterobacteria) TaxID=2636512 RepID=UPI0039B588CB
MSESIWLHYARPRPHWYLLTAAEQREKQARWDALSRRAAGEGAHFMGRYHIRGQHDFETVDVWTFPDAQAAFDYWSGLTAAAYNQWFAFANNIGLGLEKQAAEIRDHDNSGT